MVKASKRSYIRNREGEEEEEEEEKKEKVKLKRKNDKFSVYDFGVDDKLVEKESKKLIAKYKPKITKTSSSPVTKFSFLRSFSQGAKSFETCSRNELIDIEDNNDDVEHMTCTSDAAATLFLANSKASSHSSAEYCSPGANSFFYERKKAGRGISCDARVDISDTVVNNQPLSVDSDDDQGNGNLLPIIVDSDDDYRKELRSPISAPYLGRSKAPIEEHPSDYDSGMLDVEIVVTIKPDIIIFGEMYLTDATLTFSRGYIKVEGSTLMGMRNSFISTFPVSDIVKIESSWYKEVETARVELYLQSGTENLANVSGGIKLNFAICDPCWCERQEAIKSLDTIYKATWNTVTDFSKAFEGVIYPQADLDAVSISMKDIQLLQPATFINDTIIDVYIKYLGQKIDPEKRQRFHFFNSFFFRKLADEKYPSRTFDGRVAFLRVCKWTRKVNLFEKDYLFIPVNFSLHWSLIVVCHPGEVAYYEDKEMEKPLKYPCIIHMDSIKGSHRGLKNVFRSYLLEEWKEQHSELSEDVSNKFLNLPFKSMELPQQENSFDCGLFLLYFVERFLEEAPVNFNPQAAASEFLNKKWFPPAEASGRRGYIKNILYRIINDSVQKDPPTINYYDSPQNEMEGGTDEERQHTCNTRDMGSYSTPHSEKNVPKKLQDATEIGHLQFSRGYNLVHRDSLGQGDTGCSVMEGAYERCRQLKSLERSCSILSPVQEKGPKENQTAFLLEKASSRSPDWTLVAPFMQCKDENVEITSETVAPKFPNPIEIHDDENLGPEELLASTPEERTGENEPFSVSSGELHFVEDSYDSGKSDVNNHGNHSAHEAKGDSMSDQVVNSPCMPDVKGHNLHPLTWITESQDKLHPLPLPKNGQDNLHLLTWLSQSQYRVEPFNW